MSLGLLGLWGYYDKGVGGWDAVVSVLNNHN